MSNTKVTADRLLQALEKHPDLLEEVRNRLLDEQIAKLTSDPELLEQVRERVGGQAFSAGEYLNYVQSTAYSLLMIEHEFGQRDEGWTLYSTKEEAEAQKKAHTGMGAPGQFFSYEGPRAETVTEAVRQRLLTDGPLRSKGKHLPPKGTVITLDMLGK